MCLQQKLCFRWNRKCDETDVKDSNKTMLNNEKNFITIGARILPFVHHFYVLRKINYNVSILLECV